MVRIVTCVSTKAAIAQMAKAVTIGMAVPFWKAPTMPMMPAASTIWMVPISAEAVPANSPCSSIASTAVVGSTRPRKPKATNISPLSTHMLSMPA